MTKDNPSGFTGITCEIFWLELNFWVVNIEYNHTKERTNVVRSRISIQCINLFLNADDPLSQLLIIIVIQSFLEFDFYDEEQIKIN